MKKSIVLATFLLSVCINSAFSFYPNEEDSKKLESIMDVSAYQKVCYDYDSSYTRITLEANSVYELDLLGKAIVEKNVKAVEIILANLDDDYDFIQERETSEIGKYRTIGLAKKCGSEKIKNMIYEAASSINEKPYYEYSIFVELYDDYKDFLSYVLKKRQENFDKNGYDDYIDEFVKSIVRYGNTKLLQMLFDQGLDASKVNLLEFIAKDKGFVQDVSYESKKATVELLLSNGTDINILPLYEEKYRLDFFNDFNDIDFLILMLENGMPIDLVKEECLCELLDHYSDFEANEKGVYLVSLLIKAGANVNYIEKSSGESVLYKACWQDKKDGKLVRLLLENGATTKVKFRQRIKSCIPVDEVLWCGNYEALKALKEYGLKLKGKRIMSLAASSPSDSVECMKLVLEENKNINKRDLSGKSAFWWAAWRGNAKIMRFLKEQGADVNVRNYFKRQTGTMAYLDDIIKISSTFELEGIMGALDCGIDLTLKDNKGKTVRDYALLVAGNIDNEETKAEVSKMMAAIDKKLSEIGQSVELTIYDAVTTGNNAVLSELLKKSEIKASLNEPDINGTTAMEYATQTGNAEAVALLLQNGASYTKKMIADTIAKQNIEMARAFFTNGVNINISLKNEDFVNDALNLADTAVVQALYNPELTKEFLLALLQLKPNLSRAVLRATDETSKGHSFLYTVINSAWHSYIRNENECEVVLAAIKAGANPYSNDYEFFKKFFEDNSDYKDQFFKDFLEFECAPEKLYAGGLFLGYQDKFSHYEKILQRKLFVGKIMTVKENLNIRGYVQDEYDVHEEVLFTLKAGSKVKITDVLYKEEIDGMNKFWVEVELSEDAESTTGEIIKAGTPGKCYSGYLE